MIKPGETLAIGDFLLNKEIYQTYINGMKSLNSSYFNTNIQIWGLTLFTWTNDAKSFYINLNNGLGTLDFKTVSQISMCVG